jgi:hypothetical protein
MQAFSHLEKKKENQILSLKRVQTNAVGQICFFLGYLSTSILKYQNTEETHSDNQQGNQEP